MTTQKPDKGPRSPIGIWVALIAVFMAELLVYSWCRVQYVQTKFEIAEAREAQQYLAELHRKLKVEETWLKSRERIKPLAEKRGLAVPDPSKVFVLQ